MSSRITISDASMGIINSIKEYYKEHGEQLRENAYLSKGSTEDIVFHALMEFEGFIGGVCSDFNRANEEDDEDDQDH